MGRQFPNTPFEALQDFTDFRNLVMHILQSISVSEITAHVTSGIDFKMMENPNFKLPVRYIVVGNATFMYILHKAESVLTNLKDRIGKLNRNPDLSFDDKLKEYQDVRRNIWHDYQYFDSMNPIRYMSQFKWKISYVEIDEGQTKIKEEDVPNSMIDLTNGHWNEIENTFFNPATSPL